MSLKVINRCKIERFVQTDKKKQQKKDRVYIHVQNQMADKAAARNAKKDKAQV